MYLDNKRFYSLSQFFKEEFGEKTIKISLDGNLNCPNRDGTLSNEGCIFCSPKGSGDFTENSSLSITEQFFKYKEKINKKWPSGKYIAYFQSFTNTYGDINYLRKIFYEAINIKDVVGISIGTRPDCLQPEILELLSELRKKTFVFVELGFQTSNEKTGKFINRCFSNKVFEKAISDLKKINVNIVCHTIMGLPNETKDNMLNTIKYLNNLKINGIKIQLLYIPIDTKIYNLYLTNQYTPLTFDEYIDIVISCLEILDKNIVVHRLTGDGDKNTLVSPLYSLHKRKILNSIDKKLREKNTYQGKKNLDL